jgi:hypothetical protein
MPISKGHLKKNVRAIEVNYFGDIVKVSYKPSAITPTVIAEAQDAADEGDHYFMPRILSEALMQWDLAEDDIDLSKTVPSPFLSQIFSDMVEDAFPKKKSGRR